jgi:hypothetical protein
MGKINERCAGIDVGKRFLLCCALTGAAQDEPRSQTRRFEATVQDLVHLRDWLSSKSITHVVMESTGSYWVPIFNILEGHFITCWPTRRKSRIARGTRRTARMPSISQVFFAMTTSVQAIYRPNQSAICAILRGDGSS